MDLLSHFQLFMFDFDGLLVNTEQFQHRAYKKMCLDRGFELNWSFSRYCLAAHYESTGLQTQIYEEFPALHQEEPNWKVLYAEKQNAYRSLLEEGEIELMPGIQDFLELLQFQDIKKCVVTHSAKRFIDAIRSKHPILDTIPHWFTRENYTRAKPDPECYFYALKELQVAEEEAVGFEDAPRGLHALQQTGAQAVWVTSTEYPDKQNIANKGTLCFSGFPELMKLVGVKQ